MLPEEITVPTEILLLILSGFGILFVWGRASTNSHIETLRQDRAEALKTTKVVTEALNRSTAGLSEAVEEIKALRDEVKAWGE